MRLNEDELNYIADAIFNKLMERQNELEQTAEYLITDDMGNTTTATERQYLEFQIEKFELLRKQFEEDENYEKAMEMKMRIIETQMQLNRIK